MSVGPGGAAARLVHRALRPPLGDPVRFTASVEPLPPPSVELDTSQRPAASDDGAVSLPVPAVPRGSARARRPDRVVPARRGQVPAPAAVPAFDRAAADPVASHDLVPPARPEVRLPDAAAPDAVRAVEAGEALATPPAAALGWAALATRHHEHGTSTAASTVARAMAWLAEPTEPAPVPPSPSGHAEPVGPVPRPPRPAPDPAGPPPQSLSPSPPAAPAAPTVVIDRIEIVTGPRPGPPGDPLASLADRRRGASRHAGAR